MFWRVSKPEGKSVQPAEEGGSVGQEKTPPREFTPANDAADEGMRAYTWRYKAVAEGATTLKFSYVSPGGPNPIERSATRLVARRKVAIAVAK